MWKVYAHIHVYIHTHACTHTQTHDFLPTFVENSFLWVLQFQGVINWKYLDNNKVSYVACLVISVDGTEAPPCGDARHVWKVHLGCVMVSCFIACCQWSLFRWFCAQYSEVSCDKLRVLTCYWAYAKPFLISLLQIQTHRNASSHRSHY